MSINGPKCCQNILKILRCLEISITHNFLISSHYVYHFSNNNEKTEIVVDNFLYFIKLISTNLPITTNYKLISIVYK